MSCKKTQHTKQFKLDAINYRKEHPDLTQVECAKNLGIGVSTLARWEAQFRDNEGDIPVRTIHSDFCKSHTYQKHHNLFSCYVSKNL